MSEAPQAPAGWYPVDGHEQWWDGTAWTDYARPIATTATPAASATPARSFWGGSKVGSLIAAIFSAVFLVPGTLITLGFLLSANWRVIPAALFWLALLTFAILGFLNYLALSRRDAAAQAAAAAPVAPAAAPEQPSGT